MSDSFPRIKTHRITPSKTRLKLCSPSFCDHKYKEEIHTLEEAIQDIETFIEEKNLEREPEEEKEDYDYEESGEKNYEESGNRNRFDDIDE